MPKYATCFVFFMFTALFPSAGWGSEHVISDLKRMYEDYDDGRVFVVAHRGCWAAAPENSVAAIEACIRMGVEAVEIDVQLTKDDQLIVFHDGTVQRMTTAWGYVADMTLAQIKELNLVERDGAPSALAHRRFETYHKIATLQEIFEAARGKIMINLEIKANARAGYRETFEAAAKLAREMDLADHVFWKIPPKTRGGDVKRADENTRAFNLNGLPYVMPIVWEGKRDFPAQIDDFSDLNIQGFEVIAQDTSYWPRMADGRIWGADRNRYMGIAVLPQWSAGLSDRVALASPEDSWGKLLELGFDLIMTDRPEELILFLERRGLR